MYCMLLYFENVFGLFILKIRNFLSSFHLSFVIYKFIFLLLFIVSKSYIFINKNLINNAIIQTTFHWRYESNTIKRFSLRELRFLARSTFLCNREFQQIFLLHKIMGFEKSLYYHSFQIPLFMFMTNYSAASIIMPAFIMPLSNATTKRPAFASTIFLALSKLLSPVAALTASSVLSGATVIFTM